MGCCSSLYPQGTGTFSSNVLNPREMLSKSKLPAAHLCISSNSKHRLIRRVTGDERCYPSCVHSRHKCSAVLLEDMWSWRLADLAGAPSPPCSRGPAQGTFGAFLRAFASPRMILLPLVCDSFIVAFPLQILSQFEWNGRGLLPCVYEIPS